MAERQPACGGCARACVDFNIHAITKATLMCVYGALSSRLLAPSKGTVVVFVWFTGDARSAISRSQHVARELNHDRVGTQHLLLGLLAASDTVAGLALAEVGVTFDGMRRVVVERGGLDAAPAHSGHLPFTSRMWEVIESAAAGPQPRDVGPAELLLALLENPESTASQLLTGQGADLSRVRRAVEERLAAEAESSARTRRNFSSVSAKQAEGNVAVALNRFTNQARTVTALSYHMVRELMHDRHGTEHLLLALLARPQELTSSFGMPASSTAGMQATSLYPTIADWALADLGVTLDGVRRAVVERCGLGTVAPCGYVEATPRSLRVLEKSLAAAASLGHDRIGPEHLLLALLDEPESTGCQILRHQVGELTQVRDAVMQRLTVIQAELAAQPPAETVTSQSLSASSASFLGESADTNHRPPRPAVSAEPAAWLAGRVKLSTPHRLTRWAGSGFSSYARMLHPLDDHPNAPRWDAVAKINGRILGPLVPWEHINTPATPEATDRALASVWCAEQAGHLWPGDPKGGLRIPALQRLCEVLAQHTTTPHTCYFAVRADGQPIVLPPRTAYYAGAGPAPEDWQIDKTAPSFVLSDPDLPTPGELSLPDSLPPPDTSSSPFFPAALRHYYHLLEGSLDEAVRIGRWADERRFYHQSPSFIWPADHAWLVSIAPQSDSTIIGGSPHLIDQLCASSTIEALRVPPDTLDEGNASL
ncbi:Clp protease N-terminal domain-containing protein [Mycobacterium interjectum]|uniref:Clp protease N-terminal domain-containing protein n=1 Tax=Mycobacterium interjectum TaxID=33895 RepID=UPI00135AE5C6|nr:Clp protease N-terminal domain-containing protein [Mycobacterium interjectum]MCV7089803.1 hypothetical protein [Mycobacterium interjectum]